MLGDVPSTPFGRSEGRSVRHASARPPTLAPCPLPVLCPSDPSSAAQIFLRSNALMKRPLEQNDVKRRLLGHWGTCPGLNFAYAHATQLISELEGKGEEPDWLFITGVSLS